MQLEANIVDLISDRIFFGRVSIQDQRILQITDLGSERAGPYLIPGFIDAHVHIESSMLVPTEFSRLAAPLGTVATVSDPHEIANVLGIDGVEYMIENAKQAALKFHFGAPSCVPATDFETAGARIGLPELEDLLAKPEILYLAEMMNYPGVIQNEARVIEKLNLAKKQNLPIDGHAPGLMGERAAQYFSHGISTDHECFTYQEGLEKAKLGVQILIREGSAAKNYEALHPLIDQFPQQVMFCSDDKHPDDLTDGHINHLVRRAVQDGYSLFTVLKAASLNPIEHYRLPVGKLQPGDYADFIKVRDLHQFDVIKTFINGKLVAEQQQSLEVYRVPKPVNRFNCSPKKIEDFNAPLPLDQDLPAIKAIDGQLITEKWRPQTFTKGSNPYHQTSLDLLKIAVVNRYADRPIATGLIHGFGLKRGAIGSSVAHDSHNIVAVGASDRALCQVINMIIECKGGIAACHAERSLILPLPIAGIISDQPGPEVAEQYLRLDHFVKSELHSPLSAPFMTLSFMALLVIPKIKMSDLGLFDAESFQFIHRVS